jgi:colanic acid/amylovoran biosynthesis glycosyltransferase
MGTPCACIYPNILFITNFLLMNNLAILSPNENNYSETFIHAHRELPFKIFFYCDNHNYVPTQLHGSNKIVRISNKIYFKLKSLINGKLTQSEYTLRYLLKKNKIDCVLAEYGVTGASSLRVIQSLRLPLIVHFHGFDASNQDVLLKFKEKYSEMFRYAQFVVSVSKKMSADLIQLGCPEDKIILNTYGPNTDFFTIKPPSEKKRQFIAIGRFVEKKAPNVTIMAFAKVAKKYPEARLLFGGNGILLDACKDLVKELGIDEQVLFLGTQSRTQVMSLFAASLAFVQHSVTGANGDSEGTPVAILEASAAGLPVIATRHAGIPDVIEHDKTGLLVEEGDVEGMAEFMMQLYENPAKAKLMGYEGSQNIGLHFTMEKHLDRLTEIINIAMADKPGAVKKVRVISPGNQSRF